MKIALKDLLKSENGAEYEVDGILVNLVEGVTKTGKPYISGELYANGYTMPIKVWDSGLEKWLADNSLAIGDAVTVHGTISENPQNHEKQFCIRDGEGVASVVKLPEEEKEKLSSATPIPESKMLGAISGLIDYYMPEAKEGEMENPLRQYAKCCLENLTKYPYFPYSEDVHKEKGGFLSHLYNVLYKVRYAVGLPEAVQWDVVVTAVLMYHIGWCNRVDVDEVTGLVNAVDDYKAVEYGSAALYDAMYACSHLAPLKKGSADPKLRNCSHTVCVLNGLAQPSSIEAAEAYTLVQSELMPYRVSEGLKGFNEPFDMTMKLSGGEIRNFIRF